MLFQKKKKGKRKEIWFISMSNTPYLLHIEKSVQYTRTLEKLIYCTTAGIILRFPGQQAF